MNQRQQIKFRVLFAVAMITCGLANSVFAWDYGNGRHGSFVLTTNATIEQLYQTARLTNDPAQYNPADSNAIPNFQSLIITNGATLSANPWNGTNGGWIILKVQSVLIVATNSAISASSIGYRGGVLVVTNSGPNRYVAPFQGESYAGSPGWSSSANYGGGGGSAWGGGGGYGSIGSAGANGGGSGGGTYGVASLSTVYIGSGGGAANWNNSIETGGNGGGVIVLNVGNLNLQGQIQANGGSCQSFAGGGSGGSILLQIGSGSLGQNNVNANGGAGGPGGNGTGGGGNGGFGRIAIAYAEGFTGLTSPTPYTTNDPNSDYINITGQSVSQADFLGTNITLSVSFTTLSHYSMQWYFNGIAIGGSTNAILQLNNLSLTNQGSYYLTISNVVTTLNSSSIYLTVLDTNDPTGGIIPNWWKEEYELSINDPTLATNYPPGDKLTYLEKYLYGLNPLTNDTDGDGLTDYDEIFIYHTNPLLPSTAGDSIPDGWKVQYGLNPLIPIANSEAGFDGVTYMQVYQYDLTHTNLLNPNTAFSVGQGLSNYEIINGGQHTNKFYYDHEDRLQGMESSRGISIGYQYDGNGNLLRQSVLSRAAETNGLPVLWLWLNGLTNQSGIAYANSSGNGWNNYQEWLAGLSPNSNSVPSLLNNPGTNIATLAVPFTPTNWVMAAGQLNGVAGDEIIVGADGNVTGKTNSVFILTQGGSTWQVTQLPVGAMGITSIALGQPTNRPLPAIYIGLRQTGGTGAIWELMQTNGAWQTNVLAVSTNSAGYVLGVRSIDVLGSFATNGLDGGLYSLAYTNGVWNQTIISTNSSHRGLGTHGAVFSRAFRDSSVRLLDAGGIETFAGIPDYYKDNIQLPSTTLYNPTTGKYHFLTPSPRSWSAAESYFISYHGNLTLPADANENAWIASHYTESFCWMGLYWAYGNASGQYGTTYFLHYADGSFVSGNIYVNWDPLNGSGNIYLLQSPSAVFNVSGSGVWSATSGGYPYDGIGEVLSPVVTFTNQWLIGEPLATSRFSARGLSLATGFPRPAQTNSSSVFYAFADDLNQSGKLDAGDDFTLAEFVVSGNTWTTNTLVQVPITGANTAQSFSLAAVNFTGTGKDTLFTGEPDGRVYSWTGNDATNPLQRQLFSDAYVSQAWQAMSGVQTSGLGKGLAGALVNPTNQSTCNVIYWQPQVVLPTPTLSIIETAPYAAVIPSSATLGSNAVVTVRLWDNEGDASTPFLQFQFFGSTNWQNATLTALDGAAYNLATRVIALPTGNNHTLGWNALADVGANAVTNILLRASAQDFMLTGNWSVATPFQLNTTVATVSNPTNPPVNFTGITPVQGGIRFNWQGGSNAWLYLQRSPALAGTNLNWVNIWTGAPPTLMFGSYTDFFGTNPMGFYRFKVVSP
jgi:YD repeat-containing protein